MKAEPKIISERYVLQKELGSGGAAQVYLATDLKESNRKVALKLLKTKTSTSPVVLDSIKNEFETLTRLHHENLAKVFDFGILKEQIYFTEEWIDGDDLLKTALDANLNTVFQLMVQTLRALDYLHHRGMLHLDLKPDNILVTDPDRTGKLKVKIIDFGLARKKDLQPSEAQGMSGSLPYTSPEILVGQRASTGSDIYSLGILFHQIFAQGFPFESQEPQEIFREQIYQHRLHIKELNPALPEGFKEVLEAMLVKDVHARLKSPAEVLQVMNRHLEENFSLRSPTAPVHILAESDYNFRHDFLKRLLKEYETPTEQITVLWGPKGVGKSRILQWLKEGLQLKGRHPLFFSNFECLKEQHHSVDQEYFPILVDSPSTLESGQTQAMQAMLQNFAKRSIPVVLAWSEKISTVSEAMRCLEIKSLNSEDIENYLSEEIKNIPSIKVKKDIFELSEGSPQRLESILQAFKEEGGIQWGESGWFWVKEVKIDFSKLLENYHNRWKQRLKQVQEILSFASSSLDARTLEGLLATELGSLDDWLPQWVQDSALEVEVRDEKIFYTYQKDHGPSEKISFTSNWPQLEERLKDFYQKDLYEQGVQWVRLLQGSDYSEATIPEGVRLAGARLLAALGYAQASLEFLPTTVPQGFSQLGMFREIQSRAYLQLGQNEKSVDATNQADLAYQQAHDISGRARVFNLRAFLSKTRGSPVRAEEWLKKALELLKGQKIFHLEASLQMNLANYYQEHGQLRQAEIYYESCLKLMERVHAPFLTCKLQHNWVNYLYHLGESNKANEACYHWLKIAIQFQNAEQQAAALNYLGLFSGQSNHLEAQKEYLNQAVALLRAQTILRTPHFLPQFLINLAHVEWQLNQSLAAQLNTEEALQLSEKIPHPYLMASSYLMLSKILRERLKPDLAKAEEYMGVAHHYIHEYQYQNLIWELEYEQGLLKKKLGNSEEAQKHFQKSLRALKIMIAQTPSGFRTHFLRDRKLERVEEELKKVETQTVNF